MEKDHFLQKKSLVRNKIMLFSPYLQSYNILSKSYAKEI